jgi:hypothetical protein
VKTVLAVAAAALSRSTLILVTGIRSPRPETGLAFQSQVLYIQGEYREKGSPQLKRAELKRGDIVGVKTSKYGDPTRSVVVDAGAWGQSRGTFGEPNYTRAFEPAREAEKITVEFDGEAHEVTVESWMYRVDSSQSIVTMTIDGGKGWVHLTPLQQVVGRWDELVAEQEQMKELIREYDKRKEAEAAERAALLDDLAKRLGIGIDSIGYIEKERVSVALDDLKALADRFAPTA